MQISFPIQFPDDETMLNKPWYEWFTDASFSDTLLSYSRSELLQLAEETRKKAVHVYNKAKKSTKTGRGDAKWLSNIHEAGAFKDKVAACVLVTRENAIVSGERLDQLFQMCTDKKRHAADVMPALLEIFDVTMPRGRALIPLAERLNALELKPGLYKLPLNGAVLVSWVFEDTLLATAKKFLEWVVNTAGSDPQAWLREKAVDCLYELLVFPSCMRMCAKFLINKLGDPDNKVSTHTLSKLRAALSISQASAQNSRQGYAPPTKMPKHLVVKQDRIDPDNKFLLFGQNYSFHLLMVCVVESIAMLHRPSLPQKALRMGVSFLSFFVLPYLKGNSKGEVKLTSDVCDLFFGMLRQLIEGGKSQGSSTKKTEKHKAKGKASASAQLKDDDVSLMKGILAGLNSAIGTADLCQIFSLKEHVESLAALSERTKFNVSVLILAVLLKIAEKTQVASASKLQPSIVTALVSSLTLSYYEVLNRFEAGHITAKSCTSLFLAGMGRFLQLTKCGINRNKNVQAAFWKRSLQVGIFTYSSAFPVFATILLANANLANAQQQALSKASKVDDVEVTMPFMGSFKRSAYGDSAGAYVKQQSGERHVRSVAELERDLSRRYLPEVHNPAVSSAANDQLWELYAMTKHYHPAVQCAANSMLRSDRYPTYIRSAYAVSANLDGPQELSYAAMMEFILGRKEYRIGQSRARRGEPLHLCVNAATFDALAAVFYKDNDQEQDGEVPAALRDESNALGAGTSDIRKLYKEIRTLPARKRATRMRQLTDDQLEAYLSLDMDIREQRRSLGRETSSEDNNNAGGESSAADDGNEDEDSIMADPHAKRSKKGIEFADASDYFDDSDIPPDVLGRNHRANLSAREPDDWSDDRSFASASGDDSELLDSDALVDSQSDSFSGSSADRATALPAVPRKPLRAGHQKQGLFGAMRMVSKQYKR